MTILVIVALVAAALWFRSHLRNRAKRFVRAVEFLLQLEDGVGQEDANGAAMILFSPHSWPGDDDRATHRAIMFANAHTGGKQLPIIAEARRLGFNAP